MEVTQTLGLVGYFVVVSAIAMAMGVRRRAPHASDDAAACEHDPWNAPRSSFFSDVEQARASFGCSYDSGFDAG